MVFTATIHGNLIGYATLADLSAAYERARDASGEGASTFGSAKVFDSHGRQIGRISYNGRVWDNADNIIFDNRT